MISLFFKITVGLALSFIIFSFQINKKPIFYHISEMTGPIGTDVQNSLKKSVKKSYEKSKEIGEEFFSNATPKYTDKIKSKRSSLGTKNDSLEKLNRDEIRELDRVINKN